MLLRVNGAEKGDRSSGERLLSAGPAPGAGRFEYSWPWRLAPEWRNILVLRLCDVEHAATENFERFENGLV